MKQERVFLNELNSSSKAYKVKVKVIEKARPRTSPQKGIIYQSLLLEDEKGNLMRGALFGDQVDGYKDAFMYNDVYEITNAPIKACDERWKTNPREMNYQMSFGNQTVIQPIADMPGPVLPDYIVISEVPKVPGAAEKYDVLGILLFVEGATRPIVTANGREIFVRDIVVVDQSVHQPLTISAWHDLAREGSEALPSSADGFSIVGFTALRVAPHRGFSMATTPSTEFIIDPAGNAVLALTEWMAQNQATLSDMQRRILQLRSPDPAPTFSTIAELLAKTERNTLQEERHTLSVVIEDADFEQVNAYLGCSGCGKKVDVPAGHRFACSNCSRKSCSSIPRVTFNFEVRDNSGVLTLTAFGADVEKLFGMQAADLFRIRNTRSKWGTTEIEVGPKGTLARNGILLWVVKQVISSPVTQSTTDTVALGPQPPALTETSPTADLVPVVPPLEESESAVQQEPEASASADTHATIQPTANDDGAVGDPSPDV